MRTTGNIEAIDLDVDDIVEAGYWQDVDIRVYEQRMNHRVLTGHLTGPYDGPGTRSFSCVIGTALAAAGYTRVRVIVGSDARAYSTHQDRIASRLLQLLCRDIPI